MFGIETGADVLEFAEDLRNSVAAEVAEGEVGEPGATGLARTCEFILRAAGVCWGVVPLETVAPSFEEEALDKGGFGGAFVELIAPCPCAEASK